VRLLAFASKIFIEKTIAVGFFWDIIRVRKGGEYE